MPSAFSVGSCIKSRAAALALGLVFLAPLASAPAWAAADLVMTTVSTGTTAVAPGGQVALANTVRNQGNAPAGAFVIGFVLSPTPDYADPGAVVVTPARAVNALAAGAGSASKKKAKLTIPLATPFGAYYFCALADSGGAVAEDDEGNNSLCTSGTIQVTAPDLHLTALAPVTAAFSGAGSIQVANTVHNQGLLGTASFVIEFVLSPTQDNDDPGAVDLTPSRTVKTLAAGASSAANTMLKAPAGTPAGDYYICAEADAAETRVELDEDNNELCSSLVTVLPVDLLPMALTAPLETAPAGRPVTLSNTVQNQGGFPSGAFVIGFVLSPTADYADPGAVLLGTRNVANLAGGAGNTAKTKLTIPLATETGEYYLCVLVDSGAAVVESDEGNNDGCTGVFSVDSIGTFTPTDSMNGPRAFHTATRLQNGEVLVAGGTATGTTGLNSAELYDPVSNTFSTTDTLVGARLLHTATLLNNGKVLIVGGSNNSSNVLATAELYDPATNTFSATDSMDTARVAHTATLLNNGKVLIVGGSNSSGALATAELYDPATNTFSSTGGMNAFRVFHAAALLQNGKVLIAGGLNVAGFLSSAELYDPALGTFSLTGSLTGVRGRAVAELLPNGRVLIMGGTNNISSSTGYKTAELYNPTTGLFGVTGSMKMGHLAHTATLLPNGRVLIVGGQTLAAAKVVELYNPAIGKFSPADQINAPRGAHTATLLENGKVLIAGGAGNGVLSSAELFEQ